MREKTDAEGAGKPPAGETPSFVARELDRIAVALRGAPSPERYERLYVAQQALSWALDPVGFATPYDVAMGIRATTTGYSEIPHQPQS